jgi:heme exporter protein C
MFLILIAVWITAGLLIGFSIPVIVDNSTGLVLRTPQIAYFHVPMAIAMELGFMLAAWHGVQWLRTRKVQHDAASLAFAEVGFVCGLIATATGSIFAKANWGMYWSWDPQQSGITTTLLLYAALFALRGAVDDDDKKRNAWAVYALLGVMTAIFATVIYRRILPPLATLHPPNTLITSDPRNKFALWFNVFGYAMLLIYMAQLRARIEMLRETMKEKLWRKN